MPRNTSAEFKRSLFAQQTGQAFLALLEISHESLPEPLRFARNNEALVRDGQTYLPLWFDVLLPAEDDDQLPKVTLSLENIDRVLLDTILTLTSPPRVSLSVGMSGEDEIWVGPFDYTWRETGYDARTISATLEFEDLLNERWPKDEFVPSKFPGLFR